MHHPQRIGDEKLVLTRCRREPSNAIDMDLIAELCHTALQRPAMNFLAGACIEVAPKFNRQVPD
jgi:hypothetical protein